MSSETDTIIKGVVAFFIASVIETALNLTIFLKFQRFMYNHFDSFLNHISVQIMGDVRINLFWMAFYFFTNFAIFVVTITVIAMAFKSNRLR